MKTFRTLLNFDGDGVFIRTLQQYPSFIRKLLLVPREMELCTRRDSPEVRFLLHIPSKCTILKKDNCILKLDRFWKLHPSI